MRAIQVVETTGPSGVRVTDVADPSPGPDDVLIRVRRVGVSFPDLLLSQGRYQLRPEPPFTLGVDVAGEVVSGPAPFTPGQRVAGVVPYGGACELAVVPAEWAFPIPDRLTLDAAAAIPLNYLTAQFALRERGGLRAGETVLVHGAAGGVGTAALQVAKAYDATTIAVVSTEAKGRVATDAGADHAVLLDVFRESACVLTGGRGVDLVVDVVGGDAFTDSLRVLAPQGRLLVVGFASGQGIPEVKVNRLLLTNVDVRGVGWGAYAMATPGFMQRQWAELLPMIDRGLVRPPLGASYAFEQFPRALTDLAERRATGKLVVRVSD